MSSIVDREPFPGALYCPACGKYSTHRDFTRAAMAITRHYRGAHPRLQREFKYCAGPSHESPVVLPVSEFNKKGVRHGRQHYQNVCRGCMSLGRPITRADINTVRPYVIDFYERFGGRRTAILFGISSSTLYRILNGEMTTVNQATRDRIHKVYLEMTKGDDC